MEHGPLFVKLYSIEKYDTPTYYLLRRSVHGQQLVSFELAYLQLPTFHFSEASVILVKHQSMKRRTFLFSEAITKIVKHVPK